MIARVVRRLTHPGLDSQSRATSFGRPRSPTYPEFRPSDVTPQVPDASRYPTSPRIRRLRLTAREMLTMDMGDWIVADELTRAGLLRTNVRRWDDPITGDIWFEWDVRCD